MEKLMVTALPILHSMTTFFKNQGFANPEVEALFTAMLDGISMNRVFGPITFPLTEIKNRLL